MTLREISADYQASAQLLRCRLQQLRGMLEQAQTQEEVWQIQRRITVLTPMLTQMYELAELTARYYERGYYRNEKYIV